MTCLRAVLGFVACVLCTAGCFDSDEKFKAGEATTTTSGTTSGTTTIDPTTETTVGTTVEPENTCEDAISCITQCALEIAMAGQVEPDLSCLIDCVEELLTPEETVKLLELAFCCSEQCQVDGICGGGGTTGTESGTGTGTDTGGSSSSTSTTAPSDEGGDDGPPPLLDPCVTCIFACMSDPEPPGCQDLAMACE